MRARPEPELPGLGRCHQQDGGGAVGDLRRRPRRVDAVPPSDRLQRRQGFEGGLAQAFVAIDPVRRVGRLPLLVEVGGVDGHYLAFESTFPPRALRAFLRREPEAVAVLARDAPLVGDALGPLELRRHLVLREVRLGNRAARPLPDRGAEGHPAHRLDAAGEDDVDDPTAHQRRTQVRRLLRRPALRVDRGGADADREAGREPGGARDVERLLAGLGNAPGDDLPHLGRIDARPVDDGALHVGEEVGRVHARQPAVAPAEWRTGRLDDDDVAVGDLGHCDLLSSREHARMAASAAVRVANLEPLASWAIFGIRPGCLAK